MIFEASVSNEATDESCNDCKETKIKYIKEVFMVVKDKKEMKQNYDSCSFLLRDG